MGETYLKEVELAIVAVINTGMRHSRSGFSLLGRLKPPIIVWINRTCSNALRFSSDPIGSLDATRAK